MASPGRPHRERMHACIHPETYKYFFDRDDVLRVWGALEREFGAVRYDQRLRVMEIRSRELILRSTTSANPITVIRTRRCQDATVGRLHALMGYDEGAEGPASEGRGEGGESERERDAPGR